MKTLVTGVSLIVWLIGAQFQEVSHEEIAAAIEQGRAGKTLQKKCSARGDSGVEIVAMGPVGRIMRAAREAKRKNAVFSAADVTRAMAAARLTVTAKRNPLHQAAPEYVTPGMPGGYKYETELVIRSRTSNPEEAVVLEPLEPITYNSDRSSSRRVVLKGPLRANMPPLVGADMAASFDLAAFKAIPHKDVDIMVFMTDTGGHKCRISEAERRALR